MAFKIATPPRTGRSAAPRRIYLHAGAGLLRPGQLRVPASDGLPFGAATVEITVWPVNDSPVTDFSVAGSARELADLGQQHRLLRGRRIGGGPLDPADGSPAFHAIDDATSTRWRAAGQVTNQFMMVELPAGRAHRVRPCRRHAPPWQSVKRFEVQASKIGAADADFQRAVRHGVDYNRLQEFLLGVAGRGATLASLDNWGSTTGISSMASR